MCTNGEQIKLAVSLITFIITLSKPAAVPDRKLLQISKISCSVDGYKNKELEKLPCRYDWKDLVELGIRLAKFGPIFVKYSQKLFAISKGSEIF